MRPLNETNPNLPTVVGLGEVLWDVYPDAAHFGGAPANFACHAAALGANAIVVSAVGSDDLGIKARDVLQKKKVQTDFLQSDSKRPTGTVNVSLNEQGVAAYTFAMETAWDHLLWGDRLGRLARKCDAVCFGTLGQRSQVSRETIQSFVRGTQLKCMRVLDINLRQDFYNASVLEESMRLASVVKLNDQELAIVVDLLGIPFTDERYAMQQISDLYEIPVVALTRGAFGSVLLVHGQFDQVVAPPIQPVDTVGAGDAFTSAMIVGLLGKRPISVVHQHASKIASHVCTQRGATPKLPIELVEEMSVGQLKLKSFIRDCR